MVGAWYISRPPRKQPLFPNSSDQVDSGLAGPLGQAPGIRLCMDSQSNFKKFRGQACFCPTPVSGASHPKLAAHNLSDGHDQPYDQGVSSRSNVQLSTGGGSFEDRLNHEFAAGRTPASRSEGVTVAVASEA